MKTHERTKKMAECALMIAFATVLSVIPLAQLPYGGSITVASMLPIVLISYRRGLAWGTGAGLVFGVIQQLLGLSNLSYFTTWQSIVAIVFLDYLIAFGAAGLGGICRKSALAPRHALLVGSLFVSVLRYLCHVVSGATVWAGLSIPTEAALAYSLAYNATYMIPEGIVLALSAFYLGSVLDFRSERIRRLPMAHSTSRTSGWLGAGAGLLLTFALIFDTVSVFSCMQSPETGEFDLARLQGSALTAPWLGILLVTLIALSLAVALLLVRRRLRK